MQSNRVSAHSSKSVDNFNQENLEENQLVTRPQTLPQKSTSWFIFLCPLIYSVGVLIPSIVIIALASSIDEELLEENDAITSSDECQQLGSVELSANFVLYNFISFTVISTINLLLSIVTLALALCYIFFYYKVRILKRYVFASPAIPPYLFILDAFMAFLCLLQCFYYWGTESDIDEEVYRNGEQNNFSECLKSFVSSEYFVDLRSTLEGEVSSLYGACAFLFIWSVVILAFWGISYGIRRFKLKEDIFTRPI